MAIEIEKKYKLTKKQRQSVLQRLRELGARPQGEEFEENILYRGGSLEFGRRALRLRRVGDRATLTFKERLPSASPIKQQREEETEVADGAALQAILEELGFEAALVYEKRRARWRLGKGEVAIDELPFGLYLEIEASETEILRLEKLLGAGRLRFELQTYPTLAAQLGKKHGRLVEARFRRQQK